MYWTRLALIFNKLWALVFRPSIFKTSHLSWLSNRILIMKVLRKINLKIRSTSMREVRRPEKVFSCQSAD